jgi:hypothetical protein
MWTFRFIFVLNLIYVLKVNISFLNNIFWLQWGFYKVSDQTKCLSCFAMFCSISSKIPRKERSVQWIMNRPSCKQSLMVSISSTFFTQLFRALHIFSLATFWWKKHFRTKKCECKPWWNWHIVIGMFIEHAILKIDFQALHFWNVMIELNNILLYFYVLNFVTYFFINIILVWVPLLGCLYHFLWFSLPSSGTSFPSCL